MADIIIRGQAHEAKIMETHDGEAWGYECSKGAWCDTPKIDPRDNMRDVIEDAVLHVDAHDRAVNDGVPDRAPGGEVRGELPLDWDTYRA